MIIKTVKVSEKGQIAIPREIREKTGIKRGDELIVVQEGNRIMIERTTQTSERIKDDFSDLIRFSESSLRDVWDNESDEIWNKYISQ